MTPVARERICLELNLVSLLSWNEPELLGMHSPFFLD